jgi:hypothetical protein
MSDQKQKNSIMGQLPAMTRNALERAFYTDETLKLASDAELLRLPYLGKFGVQNIRALIGQPKSRNSMPYHTAQDRLWLVGTVAAGMLAGNTMHEGFVAQHAVKVADLILKELEKFNV